MKAMLMLEDGFCLTGQSVGGEVNSGGEVIFTTAMTGYQEVLTDPSYHGQLVCMTWPLIGNYGINREDMESAGIHAGALLVKECCKKPSNWRSEMSLPEFLAEAGTPCIEGLDTRALTRHLRLHGAMRGVISTDISQPDKLREQALRLPTMQGRKLTPFVAASECYAWRNGKPEPATLDAQGKFAWQGTGIPLAVYDFGVKWNILRHLEAAGFEPLCLPPSFSAGEARATGAKAAFLSNGPGDPATLTAEIATVRELCDMMPVVGICLGHQLIGHALGARTEKLKFGH
ncbi:MAG: glutamine-hydrolyzing carbamoyl-phosphate synthase small subunit, partial [Desulfovibrio sp.]|nr:glutamine-hydrolyzing carbamoyl-phosphate synthase small subunit [Desulfovibrio sp.]